MNPSGSDEELMLGYRNGDARSFEELYRRHRGPLYRYLLRQCGIAAVAEELFQDVWTNLIRARNRYEVRARFTTYLFSLAHNRLIDYYRRQAHSVPLSYDDPDDPVTEAIPADESASPERRVELQRDAQHLLELLAVLPEAQREAFLLHEEGGLTVEEIAAATGTGAETAKSRLRYAFTKLRRGLMRPTDN